MSVNVNFLFSSTTFLQIYLPLFIETKKINSQRISEKQNPLFVPRFFVRKCHKSYVDPISHQSQWQDLINQFGIKVLPATELYRYPGIIFCLDGDIYGKNQKNLRASLINQLNQKPSLRKKFTIFALVENLNFRDYYHLYSKWVDYTILPNQIYERTYQLKSGRNLYLGNPKYDIENYLTNKDRILKKLNLENKEKIPNFENKEKIPNFENKEKIPNFENKEKIPNFENKEKIPNFENKEKILKEKNKTKYAIIFYPRFDRGKKRFGENFVDLYLKIYDWLKNKGFTVIVKNRSKLKIKDQERREKLEGDYYFQEFTYFPNTSMELMQIAEIAIFFGSSVIEELCFAKLPFIEFEFDQINRFEFLRHPSYSWTITTKDSWPTQQLFQKHLQRLTHNKEDQQQHFDQSQNQYLFEAKGTSKRILMECFLLHQGR